MDRGSYLTSRGGSSAALALTALSPRREGLDLPEWVELSPKSHPAEHSPCFP